MNTHEALREEINLIDEELVKLFEKRMNVSVKIAEYKIDNNIPVFNEEREKEVIQRNMTYLSDETLKEYGEQFLNSIMGLSRTRQNELINNKSFSQNNE